MKGLAVILFLLGSIFLMGCSDDQQSDAYGQFEATETTISSKATGELLSFHPSEGSNLEVGSKVVVIDTTQLMLKKQEVQAQLEATRSKISSINAEIAVRKEQLNTALENLNRVRDLINDGAATKQQLDDTEGNVQTLRKQIEALATQKQSVHAEINAIQSRQRQVQQQIEDAILTNPIRGTVLTTFVQQYELIIQGQPLYEIANLDTLELRVYVSGAQLPSIKLGQSVDVLTDKNAVENQRFTGSISWIASEAEFTPKMIQTKEERVTQVYAVKVKVPNPNGILKIGMPGEVDF